MLSHLIAQQPLVIYLFAGVFFVVLVCAIALQFYHPTDRLHAPHDPLGPMDEEIPGGFRHRRIVPIGHVPDLLAEIDKTIRKTPRTKHVAGALETGRVTYLTRSSIWAMPSYTTLGVYDHPQDPEHKVVVLRGHTTFGATDIGESRRRIAHWMDEVDAALLDPGIT